MNEKKNTSHTTQSQDKTHRTKHILANTKWTDETNNFIDRTKIQFQIDRIQSDDHSMLFIILSWNENSAISNTLLTLHSFVVLSLSVSLSFASFVHYRRWLSASSRASICRRDHSRLSSFFFTSSSSVPSSHLDSFTKLCADKRRCICVICIRPQHSLGRVYTRTHFMLFVCTFSLFSRVFCCSRWFRDFMFIKETNKRECKQGIFGISLEHGIKSKQNVR